MLHVAASEVQIQYRYSGEFKPESVLLVTWENMTNNADDEVFPTF